MFAKSPKLKPRSGCSIVVGVPAFSGWCVSSAAILGGLGGGAVGSAICGTEGGASETVGTEAIEGSICGCCW